MNKTAICLLGKFGDVINAAPIAKHLYDTTGEKPIWVVSKTFQSVLFGVSYVEIDAVHYSIHKVQHALEYAEAKYQRVLNATAWGRHWKGRRNGNFNYLSWDSVGYGKHFDDKEGFPLIFDRRDAARESFLIDRYCHGDKPLILTCLGCSKASPFHHASRVQDAINRKFGATCHILDLCGVKAARIYDLLGLFENAACLVTTDTATLHLATAVPTLPVVALVNDNPYLSTLPRCKVAFLTPYSKAVQSIGAIHDAIFFALKSARENKQCGNALESSCAMASGNKV